MNKAKAAYNAETVFPADEPYHATVPKVQIRIEGLVPMGDGLYTLEGLVERHVDWRAVTQAIYGNDVFPGDDLLDELSDVVFKHDIRRALANRITRA